MFIYYKHYFIFLHFEMKQSFNFFNFHWSLGLTSVESLFLQVLCGSAKGRKWLENLKTVFIGLRSEKRT